MRRLVVLSALTIVTTLAPLFRVGAAEPAEDWPFYVPTAAESPDRDESRELQPTGQSHLMLARLAQIDPDQLSPREALELLYELRALRTAES